MRFARNIVMVRVATPKNMCFAQSTANSFFKKTYIAELSHYIFACIFSDWKMIISWIFISLSVTCLPSRPTTILAAFIWFLYSFSNLILMQTGVCVCAVCTCAYMYMYVPCFPPIAKKFWACGFHQIWKYSCIITSHFSLLCISILGV